MTDWKPSSVANMKKKIAGTKRGRTPAVTPPSFILNVFDAPEFFAQATVEQFVARHARGEVELEYEWYNLMHHANDKLFAHILEHHDAELSFDRMFQSAQDWFLCIVDADGKPTRIGLLLEHLATKKPMIDKAEMGRVLNIAAGSTRHPTLLDEFLKALFAGLQRLTPFSTSPMVVENALLLADQQLILIGNEFTAMHVPRQAHGYFRRLGKRGRATIDIAGIEATCEDEDVRKVLRVDAAIAKLFVDAPEYVALRGKRPRLRILSQ